MLPDPCCPATHCAMHPSQGYEPQCVMARVDTKSIERPESVNNDETQRNYWKFRFLNFVVLFDSELANYLTVVESHADPVHPTDEQAPNANLIYALLASVAQRRDVRHTQHI